MSTSLESLRNQAGKLNGRVTAAESRANEVQKKYDEAKKNYQRLRDERERLRADLEKAKRGGGASGDGRPAEVNANEMSEEGALEGVGGETMIRTQSVPSTSGVNGTGSMAELQAKYE